MEMLQDIVRILSRPIEFASRGDQARMSTVKNLGAFVVNQVIHALAQGIFPPAIETELLGLRQLFEDYHDALPPQLRKRRLAEARGILARLRAHIDERHEESGSSSRMPVSSKLQTPNSTLDTPAIEYASRPARLSPSTPLGALDSSKGSAQASSVAEDLWKTPVRFAKGVGPKRAVLLEKLGVRSLEDVLWFLPWRYEDRSVMTPISHLRPGARATLLGTIGTKRLRRTAKRGMTILEVTVTDGTGSLTCVYFNQPYLEKVFTVGARLMVSGTVSAGRRGWGTVHMDSPQHEILDDDAEAPLHVGRIVPVYHETRGLASRQIRTVTKLLLDEYRDKLQDVLPGDVLRRQRLPALSRALYDVHFPPAHSSLTVLDRGMSRAHQRLAFEELFVMEIALALRHRSVKSEPKGIRFDVKSPLLQRLRALLPFEMTAAQERVLSEIVEDMTSDRPMNRLLQGDVGCGKTVVALHAVVIACGSGYQTALMAPTEILAEQHFLNLRSMLESLGLKTVLLKSGGASKVRATLVQQVQRGEANVVIGTHALIQKDVQFARLGLAVIDEQHKFGVLQRKMLLDKGYHPDVLVLTATPIPRTLAMTVYGDLDVSVIDALPPGRKPIRTLLFTESQRRRAYQIVLDELRAGRQAYVVYPLVEESEKTDLRAVLQGSERLQAEIFHEFRVAILHGRMKTDEKERTMAAFKAGEIQVLVATTVVEVGIDVANATAMIVEHAERFGLAQLHQLRGRVGRGGQQSHCLLMMSGRSRQVPVFPFAATPRPSTARQRLEALVRSSDGFVIAEEDLRLRGPGEFFGVRQWGLPEFRAANLIRDRALLEQARREAFALVGRDPALSDPRHRALRAAMLRRWKDKLHLGSVS